MGLKLTLGTGEEIVVPFDKTSALTVTYVTTVDGMQVERAEAHADVVAIEFVDDPAPAAPAIVQMTGAEAANQDVQAPISDDALTQPPAAGDATVEPGTEPPVVEPDPTAIDSSSSTASAEDSGSATTTSEASSSESAATADTVDESFLQKVQDKLGLGHDAVVSDAQAAVDAAASGAPADHVQAALDDVNAALAAYPDSTQLQDAKAQLELQLGTQGA